MTYKNRLIFLLSLIAGLSLLYAGSFIFSPQRINTRSASHTWLDPKLTGRVTKIAVDSETQNVELLKKNDTWFVIQNGNEYPARKTRVEDFINLLSTRAPWPVRSTSASSHERLGLEAHTALRVTLYGENTVLLDLLLGDTDISGLEIYAREYSKDEVRSGENRVTTYITGPAIAWYNLRLIPESEDGALDVESVQRLSVYNGEENQIFSRRNRDWDISGIYVEDPAQDSIENYIRNILNVEGDNFADLISSSDPVFNHSRIILEFGNGRVITLRFSEPDEDGRRLASVSGSDYVYSIPAWVSQRLFRDADSFERQN